MAWFSGVRRGGVLRFGGAWRGLVESGEVRLGRVLRHGTAWWSMARWGKVG